MVTVQHLIREELDKNPLIVDMLARGLLNVSAYAESIHPLIEKGLGKKVKFSAIGMAIRRYGEGVVAKRMYRWSFPDELELSSKSGIYEVAIEKTSRLPSLLRALQGITRKKGDFLSIIEGSYEIVFFTNQANKQFLRKQLVHEKITSEIGNLAYLSINFDPVTKDIPGIYYRLAWALAFHDIPIQSFRTIGSEAIIFFKKEDLAGAYGIISGLLEKKK